MLGNNVIQSKTRAICVLHEMQVIFVCMLETLASTVCNQNFTMGLQICSYHLISHKTHIYTQKCPISWSLVLESCNSSSILYDFLKSIPWKKISCDDLHVYNSLGKGPIRLFSIFIRTWELMRHSLSWPNGPSVFVKDHFVFVSLCRFHT